MPLPRAPVPLTAQAVAELVGGRLVGDGARMLTAVGSLEGADGETLSLLASGRYLPAFRASRAGAVLLKPENESDAAGPPARIVVTDPQQAMARAVAAMFPVALPAGRIHPTATLAAGVRLGRSVSIGPHALLGPGVWLGDRVRLGAGVVLEAAVRVGDDSELGSHVVCSEGTTIGARCVIKPGAVLGTPGFGYVAGPAGPARIPHVGGCRVGDDVEIGSNSCVDRGSIEDTVIGAGSKLDNLVHVGHNARLGARCLVMGGSVIAGSADIGDEVIIAGHAAVGGHFRVGHRARIGAKSGVISAVPDATDVSGFPARPHREFLRAQAALYRLAAITPELEELAEQHRRNG
ncbi:MAG TPA: UDP-3-O-(3-hydroxymyristoyl)glucosamine N-acyltransferase [Gemmatimonadales bacterium]|nr:UDP-3-O-(3-hydroxymyristoyl)glucosamine N-acyltransferase [Gemmatimonadales bacterium]